MNKPLNHPRDLLSPEEQTELDDQLRNMADTRARVESQWLDQDQTRLIYVNLDRECDEALRMVEEAHARVADENEQLRAERDELAAIVRDFAIATQWVSIGKGQYACKVYGCIWHSERDLVSDSRIDHHSEKCPWRRARESVAAQEAGND